MNTLEALTDPVLRAIYLPGFLAGLATALMCGLLSPLVVVKRLGFIGQGISHSAFGGIGVASILAAWGVITAGGSAEFAVIVAFCILAALGMASVSRGSGSGGAGSSDGRAVTPEDTAIGIFLVGSMALGAILVHIAREHAIAIGKATDVRSWESILFGSVLLAGRAETLLAGIVLALVIATLWLTRRPMLFWAVDEDSAKAFGVPTAMARNLLMVLLALVVVTSMKVAGVVLASALLILPGAAALRLSDRLRPVIILSSALAILGLLAGFVLAFEKSWQPGPCIVAVMVTIFALAALFDRFRR